MAHEYEIKRPVEDYATDLTGKLSLPMMMNLAILSSTLQSNVLGIGPSVMRPRGYGWVILQYDITINRRPEMDEVIRIQTTVGHNNSFLARRGFKILSEEGEVLCDIVSLWAMIDIHKRRMIRLPEDILAKYGSEAVKHLPAMDNPAKIEADDNFETRSYRVRYLDIDGNQHVNNTKYIEWMLDPLDPDFMESHEVSHVKLRYENEVHLGHTINSEVILDGNTSRHRIMLGDTVSAEAEIEWRKN